MSLCESRRRKEIKVSSRPDFCTHRASFQFFRCNAKYVVDGRPYISSIKVCGQHSRVIRKYALKNPQRAFLMRISDGKVVA